MNMGLIILGVGVVAVLAMAMGKPKLTESERIQQARVRAVGTIAGML